MKWSLATRSTLLIFLGFIGEKSRTMHMYFDQKSKFSYVLFSIDVTAERHSEPTRQHCGSGRGWRSVQRDCDLSNRKWSLRMEIRDPQHLQQPDWWNIRILKSSSFQIMKACSRTHDCTYASLLTRYYCWWRTRLWRHRVRRQLRFDRHECWWERRWCLHGHLRSGHKPFVLCSLGCPG